MEALSHSLFRHNNLANLLAQTSQGGLNAQYGVHTRTKVKAEVEITTAEGDRVTLFSRSKAETAYSSYDSQGMLAGTGTSGTASIYQIVTTNHVAIAVEGDLSEEELADIHNLLQSVEDMFLDFIAGDGTREENLASSLSLDSMTTLSHFDAELKYSQKIEGYGVTTGSLDEVQEEVASGELTATDTGLVSAEGTAAVPDVATWMAFKAKTKASLHLSGTRLAKEDSALNTSAGILPEAGISTTPPEGGAAVSTAGAAAVPSAQTEAVDPVMNSVSMINMGARLRTSLKLKIAQGLLNSAPAAVSAPPQEPSAPAVQAPADTAGTPVFPDGATTSPEDPSTIADSRVNLLEEFASLVRQTSMDMNTMSTVFSQFIPRLIDSLHNNYILDENQQGAVTQMGEDMLNAVQSASPEVTQ